MSPRESGTGAVAGENTAEAGCAIADAAVRNGETDLDARRIDTQDHVLGRSHAGVRELAAAGIDALSTAGVRDLDARALDARRVHAHGRAGVRELAAAGLGTVSRAIGGVGGDVAAAAGPAEPSPGAAAAAGDAQRASERGLATDAPRAAPAARNTPGAPAAARAACGGPAGLKVILTRRGVQHRPYDHHVRGSLYATNRDNIYTDPTWGSAPPI
jgi:hypothetical protein